jgi:hypothetical protein
METIIYNHFGIMIVQSDSKVAIKRQNCGMESNNDCLLLNYKAIPITLKMSIIERAFQVFRAKDNTDPLKAIESMLRKRGYIYQSKFS